MCRLGATTGGLAMKDATIGQSVKILSIFSNTPAYQIQSILESGLLTDLRDGKNIAQVKRDEFRQLLGLKSLTINPETLLDPVATMTVPATIERFVAKDRFVVNTGRSATVKISYLTDNFQSWFLDKIEEPIAESTLRSARLRKASVDKSIIAELGGEDAEITLTEIFSLIMKQPNGESGELLTNGYANIFYVRDSAGVLRAVAVGWHGFGWSVFASSIEGPDEWYDDYLVFSRNRNRNSVT